MSPSFPAANSGASVRPVGAARVPPETERVVIDKQMRIRKVGGTYEEADESNLEGGRITVRHEIRKLFLVSDNRAFNRLYELVGRDRLAASLERSGRDNTTAIVVECGV